MEQEFDSLLRERRVPSEAAIEAAAQLRWSRTESDSSPTRQWADAPAWIQKAFRETSRLELCAAYSIDGVRAVDGVGGGGDVPPNEPYASQARTRESAEAETRRRGFEPGELQYLWRTPECFARTYDMGEVGAAICDALTREGCTAWWGDGTSCVEQMIRLQWDRAEKAERELAALRVVGGGASPEGPWEIITNEDGDVRIQRQPIANGKRPSVLLPLTWGPRDPEAIAVRDALNRVASRSPQP
jgi:hypothetical protein